jgi:LEA14-like dessication related protein
MVDRDFAAGVEARLHHKDYGILMDEAHRLGVPLPLAAQVWQQLNALMAMGWGSLRHRLAAARSGSRFILTLRVQNPNDVELRINGLSVEVELNGQPFITGLSDKGVTVPRFGEAVLEVMATSTLGSALKQLRELQKGGRERIDYRIVGRLNLSGIGTVPFERRGDLQMPAVVSPLRKPLPPGTQGT